MKNVRFVTMMLLFALCSVACNKKACERVCECQIGDEDDADLFNECVKNCKKAIEDEKDECQDAYRIYARCLDRYNCEPEGACELDAEEMAKKCDEMGIVRPVPGGDRGDNRFDDWEEASN